MCSFVQLRLCFYVPASPSLEERIFNQRRFDMALHQARFPSEMLAIL